MLNASIEFDVSDHGAVDLIATLPDGRKISILLDAYTIACLGAGTRPRRFEVPSRAVEATGEGTFPAGSFMIVPRM